MRILITAILALVFATASSVEQPQNAMGTPNTTLPVKDIELFSRVYSMIKSSYYKDVDSSELIRYAIDGMLSGLDPHSAFLDEKNSKDFMMRTQGEYGGLGLQVSIENGFVKVIAPFDESPGAKAGIKAGDIIVQIEDQYTSELGLEKSVELMRGKSGTYVTLKIVREGETQPLEFKVKREEIKIPSVAVKLVDKNYIYIRISSFADKTAREFIDGVKKVMKENPKYKGVIVDLRNNPGGRLDVSIEISDYFLAKDSSIVIVKGRTPVDVMTYKAKTDDMFAGKPVVVLINEGSASASEILSGALKDNDRAVLVGHKTFGKGSVQALINVEKDVYIKLTTALYYTPSGTSIQAEGIEPDILVDLYDMQREEEQAFKVGEKYLSKHVENPNSADKKGDKNQLVIDSSDIRDSQLFQALSTLKTLEYLDNLDDRKAQAKNTKSPK